MKLSGIKITFKSRSSISVIYCDCVCAGLSRAETEKEEGIADMIVWINLDRLISVMTVRQRYTSHSGSSELHRANNSQ